MHVQVAQQMHVLVERATRAQVVHVILAPVVLQMPAPGAHLTHDLVDEPILVLADPQTPGPVVHVMQDPVGHAIRVQAEDGTVRPYVDKKFDLLRFNQMGFKTMQQQQNKLQPPPTLGS